MDLNSINLTGRLARNAETKLVGGSILTDFSLAVGYATKDQSGQWQNMAHFFDVKLWGKQGEALNQYLIKGQMVAISGRLTQEKWEKDGKNYSKVIIAAHSITLCGGKKDKDEPQSLQEARAQLSNSPQGFEDDIPF